MTIRNIMFGKKFVAILLLSMFILISCYAVFSLPRDDSLSQTSTDEAIILHLYNGTYGDYDDDNREDDVSCYLDVSINRNVVRKVFMLDITLILPNSDTYVYSILVSTIYDFVTFHMLFINHAYVAGDYTIVAEVLLLNQGYYYDLAELIFDPPTEEIPDAEPFFLVA